MWLIGVFCVFLHLCFERGTSYWLLHQRTCTSEINEPLRKSYIGAFAP